MRTNSGLTAVAALAAVGCMLVATQAGARSAGTAASRVGSGSMPRTGVAHHAPVIGAGRHGAYRPGRGFWGWGGWSGVAYAADTGVYAPYLEPAGAAPTRDFPLVDFYNTDIYTGGPYASPLGYWGYPPIAPGYGYPDAAYPYGNPAAHRSACDIQNQIVPNPHHGTSRVTIVRC